MRTSPRTTVAEDKIPGPCIGEIHILSRTFFSSHKNIDRKQQISEKVIFRFILGSINSGRFLFVLGFNGIIFTEMATLGSAKSNVMKLVIPTVKKCLLPAGRPGYSFVSLMCRSFSTDAAKYRPEGDSSIEDDRESRRVSEIRRGGFPNVFDDPFYPLRSLGFGLDQLFDNPFLSSSRGTGDAVRGGSRKPWDATEDKDALYVRVDMPGLGKEDLNIYAEDNALVIKGESLPDAEFDGSGRKYSRRIELPAKVYKLDQIKAQMKNGVLKVIVPKFTEEEVKNVINVQVE